MWEEQGSKARQEKLRTPGNKGAALEEVKDVVSMRGQARGLVRNLNSK